MRPRTAGASRRHRRAARVVVVVVVVRPAADPPPLPWARTAPSRSRRSRASRRRASGQFPPFRAAPRTRLVTCSLRSLLETRASPLILPPPSDPGAQKQSPDGNPGTEESCCQGRSRLPLDHRRCQTAHSKSEDSLVFTSGCLMTASACTGSPIFILIANI